MQPTPARCQSHPCARRASVCCLTMALLLGAMLLAGCATPPQKPTRTPEQVHAQVLQLLPARAIDRERWAAAITDAVFALQIDPTSSHVCAALAVAEQESGFIA